MMASVELVPMLKADLDQVMELERRIYAFPWTRGNFSDSLEAGYSAWLLRADQALVGYAVMLVAGDEAQLLNISISPAQQRAGLGSRLLGHLREVAAAGGGQRLLIEVRLSNQGALAFYQGHGFRRIGQRRDYYPGVQAREDAVVMELAL